MMSSTTLASWVKKRPAKTSKIALFRRTGEDTYDPIRQWDVGEELPVDDKSAPFNFAERILETAQDDCDDCEVVTSYRLRGLNDTGETLCEKRLRMEPHDSKPDIFGVGADTAGNTTHGQLVRVCEVQLKTIATLVITFREGYERLIKTQALEMEAMRKREQKLTDFALDMVSAAAGEEESVERDRKIEKFGEILEKVAPIVANKAAAHIGGTVPGNGQ